MLGCPLGNNTPNYSQIARKWTMSLTLGLKHGIKVILLDTFFPSLGTHEVRPRPPTPLSARRLLRGAQHHQPNSLQRLGRPLLPTRAFEPPPNRTRCHHDAARGQSPRPTR